MKFVKKLNRGLIVFLVALIVVAAYLVTQSISHNAAMPGIKNVCEKFINTAISYEMLPEKYRMEKPDIEQAKLDKYLDDMASDIKAFYIDNEQTYKYLIAQKKAGLESQAKGSGIIYSYKKVITDYKKVVFDGNTVTLTIQTNSSLDGPDVTSSGGMERENISAQTTDTITLQRVKGEWKLVYADLQKPLKAQNSNGVTTKVMYR